MPANVCRGEDKPMADSVLGFVRGSNEGWGAYHEPVITQGTTSQMLSHAALPSPTLFSQSASFSVSSCCGKRTFLLKGVCGWPDEQVFLLHSVFPTLLIEKLEVDGEYTQRSSLGQSRPAGLSITMMCWDVPPTSWSDSELGCTHQSSSSHEVNCSRLGLQQC